jgi:hypothetical protein
MITVLGKLSDTDAYANTSSYNVMAECLDWTPQKNFIWLKDAVLRGDEILLVSRNIHGYYGRELLSLLYLLILTGFKNKIRLEWDKKYVTQG